MKIFGAYGMHCINFCNQTIIVVYMNFFWLFNYIFLKNGLGIKLLCTC